MVLMNFNRCMDKNMFPEATNAQETTSSMNMNIDMNGGINCCPPRNMMCQPIMECPQVNCCHRVINYEVPHIIPCHTKMINHHIYRHTYQPCYSYSEENESQEIYEPRCCK